MPFASLGLTSPLARVAADQGFVHPTPIQTAAIPAMAHLVMAVNVSSQQFQLPGFVEAVLGETRQCRFQ